MSKEHAYKTIDAFEANTLGRQAFRKLDRKKVADDLRSRVDKPFLINQGAKAGICGPAVIAYEILRTRPQTYVSAATRLFENGSALIDKWTLKPDDDLLKAPCPATVAQGDWVMLASIRDSENWLLDFHDDDSTYAESSTLGEINDWMKKAGFREVSMEEGLTNIFDKTEMFRNALKKYTEGFHVIIRINSSCIDSLIPNAPIVGNHVVVLIGDCSPPANKSNPISIPIYTWGSEIKLPRAGGLTYAQFLEQFFGYVAAKA